MATGKLDNVVENKERSLYVIANYFKLRNKRKIMEDLMSHDKTTREFFIDILKFKLKNYEKTNKRLERIKKKSL